MEQSGNGRLIVVVDDDRTIRRACEQILTKVGYQVETFEDGFAALARIRQARPSLIVVDLKMPRISGMELIEQVKGFDPEIVIVVITGYATVGTAVEAMKAGAYDFVPKPFTPEELRVIINRGFERRRLAVEARRLREEKEALQRRYITFVSHQLQSPLAAVAQYLDVLRHLMQSEQAARPEWLEWLKKSNVRIKQLIDIISDWLTLSKVERGVLAEKHHPVEIGPIIDEVVDLSRESAEQKRVRIKVTVPEKLPAVMADPIALQTVLANLMSNAIKYNRPNGDVSVEVHAEDGRVTVCVIDTGVGISEEYHDSIFEDFFRVKDDSTAKISGTGLGLPICKRIVEELAGSIAVRSEPGTGSTFTVELPACELPAGDQGEQQGSINERTKEDLGC